MRVVLTERDEQLLLALARFRVARTQDLVSFAFDGVRPDTAAARLRRLFDAELIAVEAGDRATENVYRLGAQGRQYLQRCGVRVRSAPRGSVEHHLAIVRTWVALAVLARVVPGVSLVRFRPDWEVREALPAGSSAVVPDALTELGVAAPGGGTVAVRFALEVDLGTESLRRLGQKVEAYAREAAADGGLFGDRSAGIAVVLAQASAKRAERVAQLLERVWASWWLLWNLDAGPTDALGELIETVLASPYALPLRQGEG